MTSKKAWVEPELIVLVRNNPEEAVLETCKGSGGAVGPYSANSGCDNGSGPCDAAHQS